MPAFYLTSIAGTVVTVSDGRTFDLSTISGNGYNATRLARINAAIQALFDVRIRLVDLPVDDPDRTINPSRVGLFWSDVDGNPLSVGATHLTGRSTRVYLTFENGSLIPRSEEVR